MAAFASDRRSGWVRVLVLILCALFIFATIATPPAYAVGETVALFGLAAVLSAATAALGFKLANNTEGRATLEKMVQDFTGASIAAGLVLTGSKVNGLINGMQYIKMAVHNGKTYLDERIFAWVQQWLAVNGVYDSGQVIIPSYTAGEFFTFGANPSWEYVYSALIQSGVDSSHLDMLRYLVNTYSLPVLTAGSCYNIEGVGSGDLILDSVNLDGNGAYVKTDPNIFYLKVTFTRDQWYRIKPDGHGGYNVRSGLVTSSQTDQLIYLTPKVDDSGLFFDFCTLPSLSSTANDTGLSGTDTLGKDVIDLTLDQILEKLKEWAQDWFDAGADSVTNAATGAKDLPLSVATGAATLNPDVAEDGPLVYFPTFGWSLPKLRSGETDTKTVDQGKENASAAETSTVDVAENQTVIDSLVNWALGYISPDTGLFSKFPLCVPYDAYLLACSALGVGVVGSDSIFGASPDDLSSIVQTGDEQSEGFTPVITISNDLTLDGNTYPIDLTIDLTDWTPLIKFVRLAISITVIAELIGAEYKRIKGK